MPSLSDDITRHAIIEMYRFQRNPAPKPLTWERPTSTSRISSGCRLPNPARGQSIDVKVEGNVLTLQAEKVEELSLWLDRRLIDVAQPFEVTLNGKTTRHQVTPALGTLCESILRRGDLGLAA